MALNNKIPHYGKSVLMQSLFSDTPRYNGKYNADEGNPILFIFSPLHFSCSKI